MFTEPEEMVLHGSIIMSEATDEEKKLIKDIQQSIKKDTPVLLYIGKKWICRNVSIENNITYGVFYTIDMVCVGK